MSKVKSPKVALPIQLHQKVANKIDHSKTRREKAHQVIAKALGQLYQEDLANKAISQARLFQFEAKLNQPQNH